MTIYKGKIRQKKQDGTYDYLLPETTIDQVYDAESGKFLDETLNDLKMGTRFRKDSIADTPLLDLGEPAITSDTKQVFIGTGTENIEMARADDLRPKLNEEYVGIPVEKIGLVADDRTKATTNTQRLNEYLRTNQYKTLLFLSKDYYFDNTIYLTSTNKLKGTSATHLLLINNDVDFIDLDPYAVIESFRLTLFENHTKICIKIHNKNFMQFFNNYLHCIKDIFIYGNPNSISSTGISLYAEGATEANVSNLTVNNVTIMWCKTGITIDAIGPSWCNGNYFDNIYIQCCITGIYLGKNVGGNRFLYQYQFRLYEDIVDDVAILCEGFNNIFIGMTWDATPFHRLINCTMHSSTNNFIGMDFGRNALNHNIVDDGRSNIFSGFSEANRSIPITTGAYKYSKDNPLDWATASWQQFYGGISNILHNADKVYTTSINLGGSALLFGEVENVFNMSKPTVFGSTTVENPIVIDIDFNEVLSFIPEIGITFDYGCNARYVKIEYTTTNNPDEPYTVMGEMTDNTNHFVTYETSTYGADIKKVRITLADANVHPQLNPSSTIMVGCIFMYSNGKMGNYYLPTDGGNLFGDLNMHGNAIRNKAWESGATSERPTNPQPYQEFFDTTVGRPIWWNAAKQEWLDVIGTGGVPEIVNQIPQTTGAVKFNNEEDITVGHSTPNQQFYGIYSNTFNYADKIHTINLSLGESTFWYGGVDGFFDSQKPVLLAPTTVVNPIIIDILLTENLANVSELGITFSEGRIPRHVKMEIAESPTSTDFYVLTELTDNISYFVNQEFPNSGMDFGRLRITLANGIIHPLLNPQGAISIGNIYMYKVDQMGNYYLPAKGGEVYGSINMNKQPITNKVWHSGSTTARPTAPVAFQEFFDTTIGKPIWRNAANTAWVDANGTSV